MPCAFQSWVRCVVPQDSRLAGAFLGAFLIVGLFGVLGVSGLMGAAQPAPEPAAEAASHTTAPNVSPNPAEERLTLSTAPLRQIFSRREGVTLVATFKAKDDVTVCLEKDPLIQFDFAVYRAGTGKLSIAPPVQVDNRVLYQQRMMVRHLKRGERLVYRLNLRRLQFLDGERWDPGDYQVKTTFRLCDPATAERYWDSAGKEWPLKAQAPAHFMIMD